MNSIWTSRLTIINFLLILAILGWFFGVKKGNQANRPFEPWKVIPEASIEKKTLSLDCGGSQEVYKNTGELTENLVFVFENKCEFQAFAEKMDSSEVKKQIIIPGYSLRPGTNQRQSSFELGPGESFQATCSNISTVANEGCTVTWWISARRNR